MTPGGGGGCCLCGKTSSKKSRSGSPSMGTGVGISSSGLDFRKPIEPRGVGRVLSISTVARSLGTVKKAEQEEVVCAEMVGGVV